jgi:hypothetical protein
MLTMAPSGGLTFGNDFTGRLFKLTDVDWIAFEIQMSAGTVTIQYCTDAGTPTAASTWASLDATNLVWTTTGGTAVALFGGVWIRAKGSGGTTTVTSGGITGRNVVELEPGQQP